MRIKHLVLIFALLTAGLLPAPAHAGGVVTICGEAHLLAALAGGGTVTFACSGTIILTNTITIAADTTIDGSGQAITISGNNAVQVFTVNAGATLNLNRLAVADGRNNLGSGAGIINQGTLILDNSTLLNNHASTGGGIYNAGALTVNNSTFLYNNAFNEMGGGILNFGTGTVNSSTFLGNSALYGGGIMNDSWGALTVSNSTFLSNLTSGGPGGGIHNGGTLTVSNSTFSGNSAGDQGGGIANFGTLAMSNCTMSSNSSGIHQYSTIITLKNTIVADSTEGHNCFGTITDGGGNLTYPDTTCPGINADPMLAPLQNNGGPTETMALWPGSAAIDAGDDVTCASAPVNSLDQRGVTRPRGAHCDIGAFEWMCPSFVPPAQVGIEDIVAIASRWGWTNATPRWDPVFDLNLDNRIDILDIMLVTAAWGYTCS